ncbi:MAG: hypothetical protein JWO30_1838 [Fibrobacteres bacterium]|nr:hypothetical protein [Fibrobacterota bacterium]
MKTHNLKFLALGMAGALAATLYLAAPASAAPASTPAAAPAPEQTPATGADKTAAPAAQSPTAAEMKMTDPEILAYVIAVDDNEINAAKAAQKKKVSPEVKSFAKMLQTEHDMNKVATKKLAKDLKLKVKDTKGTDGLRTKGKQELTNLKALNGEEFSKAYVEAMAKGHTEALDLIDNQLIPSAQTAEVKAHLADTRTHVAAHLEQAKRLQSNQASRTE